jgi:hypothetical protein
MPGERGESMHLSIEQYLAYQRTKRWTIATVKVMRHCLISFVAWCERTRQCTSDPVLLRDEDLLDWCMLWHQGLAPLSGYNLWLLASRLLIEHPATEVKHVPAELLAPRALIPHPIDAMLRAVCTEYKPSFVPAI